MYTAKEDIAIIGIGCKAPGNIHGPQSFFTQLLNGVNGIREVPENRWNASEYYDPNPNKAGKIKTNKGGFIDDIDLFDNEFFSIFPKEAERIDPQHRMVLQAAYESVEDAGDKLAGIRGSNTSVFMAGFLNDYQDIQLDPTNRYGISPHIPMGVSATSLANRLSYVFNLKGASVSIDTACSGSLVAVHMACESIWTGSCDASFAGGANALIIPESTVAMSKGNFLSPDGLCRSFDEKANGYVRSEGVGVVYLKRLSKALEDGNNIYAVIKSAVCNSDGFTKEGFTVPCEHSQTAMLRAAYAKAGIDAGRVQYVEAHGTGTPVGDPIETKAFSKVFSGRSEDTPLLIGSVKSNIGHLEGAAGVAGLIKLALSIRNKVIPGNLHFEKVNPKIDLDNWRLKVVAANTGWPEQADGSPRVGGVNSFGAGGTNAHVVVEEYIDDHKIKDEPQKDEHYYLFHISAQTEQSLNGLLAEYREYISTSTISLRDICYNIGRRRSDLKIRIAIAGKDKQDIIEKIDAYLAGGILAGVVKSEVATEDRKIAFVFTGQGPQWYAMGQELIASEPLFRNTILEIEQYFNKVAGWSLLDEMNKDEHSSRIDDTRIAQPAIMAVQIALVELWRKHGISPEGVVGHSIGEVAAAYTAGSLTLEQAVSVIFHRSRGQHAATGKGKMLAISITQPEAEELIKNVKDVVSIGAVNGPAMIVLSGDEEPLKKIAAEMEEKDIFHRFLRVTVPFHSYHMEPLKDELISSLQDLKPAKSNLALYSTVTGKKEDGTHLVSSYWYDNVREPVYFANALEEMVNDGFNTFIEIGPHPALSQGAEEVFAKAKKASLIFPSIKRKEGEKQVFLQTLGSLYAKGVEINWDTIYPDCNPVFDLPVYKWDLKRFWQESAVHYANRLLKKPHPLVTGYTTSGADESRYTVNVLLDKRIDPYLDDHKVDGAIIFPATGHLEIAMAAAKAIFGTKAGFLEDLNFESGLFLPDEGEIKETKIEVYSDEGKYWILTRDTSAENAAWVKHSNGKMNVLGDEFVSNPVDLQEIRARVNDRLPVQPMYTELKKSGLFYGETFRAIKNLWIVNDEVLGKIELHESLAFGISEYLLHPSVLDACLHTIFAAKMVGEDQERGIYLPVHMDRYKFHEKPTSATVWSYVQVTESSAGFIGGDFWIMNEDGTLVAEVQGLKCKYIEGSRGCDVEEVAYSGCYEYQWSELQITSVKRTESPVVMIKECDTDTSRLETVLAGGGSPVVSFLCSDLKDRDATQSAFAGFVAANPRLNRFIFITPETVSEHDVMEQSADLSWKLLNLFSAVIAAETEPVIWIVNEGSEKITDADTSINLQQSVVYGLSRVMINEYPSARLKIADLSDRNNVTEIENLAQLICSENNAGNESEFGFRDDVVYVRRLQAVEKETAQERGSTRFAASGNYYKTYLGEKGFLDSVRFRQIAPFELPDNYVEIDVKASGLNFKDVLNLMGVLSEESVRGGLVGSQLGLECSGVVARIGKHVTRFRVGDEVLGVAANSLSGKAMTPEHCIAHKPLHLTHEQAATVTIVYLTAWYSMFYIGQMEAGERMLIHSGTGGVGLAAIQLAKLKGIEIYATAGSQEKRALLREMGIQHVYDSRSLHFYDQVMADTNGEGVDLVLNSLSGRAIIQSIKCLRPFGRFVEIGKADVYNDMSIHLKRFGDNLSYSVVDIDRLMAQKPAKAAGLFRDVMELFNNGLVEIHPFTTFTINDLSSGLDYISKGKHIGKVVVSMEQETIQALPPDELRLKAGASYIITGGASGFGLEIAKWMAERGATNLCLVSRSGPKTAYDLNWIEKMRSNGVDVLTRNVDLTSLAQVQRLVKEVNQQAPLAGIIHGAAVLEDATIQKMSFDSFKKVFYPKALGAWNLHLATEALPLDIFLTLSSIAAVVGIPGQASYATANHFMDKLMISRRAKGLCGQSVNLGLLGTYSGMINGEENLLNILGMQGWDPLTFRQAMAKIERVLLDGDAVRMLANVDWLRFRDFFSHLQADGKFAHLLTDEALKTGHTAGHGDSLKDKVLAQDHSNAVVLLTTSLKEALARILGTTADKLDETKSVAAIGLDSLMMNQLRNWIHQKLEFNYPLMKMSKGPSIAEIASFILTSYGEATETVSATADETEMTADADIEVVNEWFIRKKAGNSEGCDRLFMFHGLGVGASTFSDFLHNPPPSADVHLLQLPGRENRKDEPAHTDLTKLIPAIVAAMLPLLDRPFAVYGHSFGGLIAFEVTRVLRTQYGKTPTNFLCAGTTAPQVTHTWQSKDALTASRVSGNSIQKLYGSLPDTGDKDLEKRTMDRLKRDITLLSGYEYYEGEVLDCPITIFSATEDEVTLPEEMTAWKELTGKDFRQYIVNGGHWFNGAGREVIQDVLSEIYRPQVVESVLA